MYLNYIDVQRLKLANAMEKIFGSNEMPEDLAGERCTSKHEKVSSNWIKRMKTESNNSQAMVNLEGLKTEMQNVFCLWSTWDNVSSVRTERKCLRTDVKSPKNEQHFLKPKSWIKACLKYSNTVSLCSKCRDGMPLNVEGVCLQMRGRYASVFGQIPNVRFLH